MKCRSPIKLSPALIVVFRSPYLFYTIRQKSFNHTKLEGDLMQISYESFQMQLVEEVIPLLSLNPAHKGHDGRKTFITIYTALDKKFKKKKINRLDTYLKKSCTQSG